MAIVSLPELKAALPPKARLLGFDLGEKTIGLALSDTLLTVATPLETLKRGKFTDDAAIIDEIMREHGVGGLVIGLPLSLDGNDGPAAQSARAFARNFAARSDIAHRAGGRALFDRRGDAHAAGGRRLAQAPRRSRGQDGGGLHPAGRARRHAHEQAMTTVLGALIPTFLIIALSVVLKNARVLGAPAWEGMERATYFIFFPVFLFRSLADADFGGYDVWPLALALFGGIASMAAILWALRRRLPITGPQYTSVYQGAIRWNGFVAVATMQGLYGALGATLTAVAFAVIVPIVNTLCVLVLTRHASNQTSARAVAQTLARNPLIIACVAGIAWKLADLTIPDPIDTALKVMADASITLGLFTVGSGMDFFGLFKNPRVLGLVAGLKLLAMPLMMWAFCVIFGVTGPARAVAVVAGAVPTATNAYILARQLGGDFGPDGQYRDGDHDFGLHHHAGDGAVACVTGGARRISLAQMTTLRHVTSINDLSQRGGGTCFRSGAALSLRSGRHTAQGPRARAAYLAAHRPQRPHRRGLDSRPICSTNPARARGCPSKARCCRLGGGTITSADPATSSAAKGESLADTVRVVSNYADAIVIRHPRDGAAKLAAEYASVPVINGGDGAHEHPTQTLCDLFTLSREKNKLKNLNVVISGDLRGSRTIHSFVYALARFGANIMLMPGAKGMELPAHVDWRLRNEFHCRPVPREKYGRESAVDAALRHRGRAASIVADGQPEMPRST